MASKQLCDSILKAHAEVSHYKTDGISTGRVIMGIPPVLLDPHLMLLPKIGRATASYLFTVAL
jgi:hypothetical protein